MRIIYLLACFLPAVAAAQEKIYFNSNWQKIDSTTDVAYYAELLPDKDSANKVTANYFFASGKKQSQRYYADYKKHRMEGPLAEWYENGQLKMSGTFINGSFEGELLTYHENGQLRRRDNFMDQKLVSGKCYNKQGEEIPYSVYFVPAKFPGAENALITYLQSELKYPKKAIKQEQQGTVIVGFIVNKDGSLSDIFIDRSFSKELDAEALRVVKNMPNWKPAREEGELVRSYFRQPITFKLQY